MLNSPSELCQSSKAQESRHLWLAAPDCFRYLPLREPGRRASANAVDEQLSRALVKFVGCARVVTYARDHVDDIHIANAINQIRGEKDPESVDSRFASASFGCPDARLLRFSALTSHKELRY